LTNRYPYEKVQASRLYEQVAEQIRARIIAHEVHPGDKLASESELAGEFGVSRTVIREALKLLENQQLVEVRHGSGTYVCEPGPDAVAEALSTLSTFRGASVFDLHDVREILEVEVAALAAENATEEQKAELGRLLDLMHQAGADPEEYVRLDLLFHATLARATGNEVFLLLIEPLADLLVQSRLRAIQAPDGPQESLRGHRAIYDSVMAGNPDQARAAMQRHLAETRKRLVASKASDLIPDG
jgi:GntR family transcriptional repressor for pyruvate dehydrogenase complex